MFMTFVCFNLYYVQINPWITLAQIPYARLMFSDVTDACYSNNTQSTQGWGSIDCDFPAQCMWISRG